MSDVIPDSVLKILGIKWAGTDPGYSRFESNFNNAKRISQPSFYYVHKKKEVEYDGDVLSNTEAVSLVKDEVFGSAARIHDSGTVVINEHAQHAFIDFCNAVYSEWRKYHIRLAEVESRCPPPSSQSEQSPSHHA